MVWGLVSRNLQASPELWIIVQIQSALKVCLAEMSLLCSFGAFFFLNLMNQKQFFQPKNGAFLKSLSNGRFLGKFRNTEPRDDELFYCLPQEFKTVKLHFRQNDSERIPSWELAYTLPNTLLSR